MVTPRFSDAIQHQPQSIVQGLLRDRLIERYCHDVRPDLNVEFGSPAFNSNPTRPRIWITVSDQRKTREISRSFDFDGSAIHFQPGELLESIIAVLRSIFTSFPTNGPASLAKSARYRSRAVRARMVPLPAEQRR